MLNCKKVSPVTDTERHVWPLTHIHALASREVGVCHLSLPGLCLACAKRRSGVSSGQHKLLSSVKA